MFSLPPLNASCWPQKCFLPQKWRHSISIHCYFLVCPFVYGEYIIEDPARERSDSFLSFLPSAAANNSRNSFAKIKNEMWRKLEKSIAEKQTSIGFHFALSTTTNNVHNFFIKSQPNQYTSTGIHVDTSMRMPPSQKVAMVMVYSGDMNSSSRVDSVSSRYTRKGNAFRQALITTTKRQFRLSFHHQLVYIEL